MQTKHPLKLNVQRHLSEFLDGYFLIGKVAGKRQFIVMQQLTTNGQRAAAIASMAAALDNLQAASHWN